MDDFGMGYALGQDSSNGSGCNNGGGMWGGDGSWIFAFLIIALIFGGNGWGGFGGGWGGNGGGSGVQGALTRGDLCSEFNFNDLSRAVSGVTQGLCDGFYAMNTGMLNGFNGLGSQIAAGFAGVDNSICTLGYQNAQLINGVQMGMMQGFNGITAGLNSLSNQLASCCCDTQRQIERGFCDLNYNLATQSGQTRQAIADSTRSILDYLCQEKISDLQSENQSLKLAASQAAQNNYLVNQLRPCPQPAYITCNPFTGLYGGYQYGGQCNNGGCGCC